MTTRKPRRKAAGKRKARAARPADPAALPAAPADEEAIEQEIRETIREACEVDLATFTKEAWPTAVPGDPLQWNWHMDAVCDHLQAVARLEINRLLITIPPRHGKSTLSCVMLPAWMWINDPTIKAVYSSYSQTLSTRDSTYTRRLITSPWYQSMWADRFTITSDQNEKMRFENDKRGYRLATSVGGANTGEGGNLLVVDDPHNIQEVESDVTRESVIRWYFEVMSTRSNNPKQERRIVIGQRSHEADLMAAILERSDYVHLNLPVRYEPSRVVPMRIGQDPRSAEGELLWPDRNDEAFVTNLERIMGSRAASAQLQQRPTPAEGGMFKRAWWKHYRIDPKAMFDSGYDDACWSWDCAFKDLDDSDFVVGQLWIRKGANFYLIAQVRERMSFTGTKAAVKAKSQAWPKVGYKLVEDKANGTAVIDDLKATVGGLVAVEPKGGKEARASVVEPYCEAGNIWLPDIATHPWVDKYIDEFAAFPKGVNDDQVDSTSQAIVWMLERYKINAGAVVDSYTKNRIQKPRESYRDPRDG